ASTLVAERDGIVWPDHDTIPFDHAWQSAGSGRAGMRPVTAPASRNGDTIFFTSGTTGKPKMIVQTPAAREQRILHSKTSMFADFERALVAPGLSSAFGFQRASEILYAGKTVCFARFGNPMLLLANTYEIDIIFASTQQAIALAEIQEKLTHFR